MSGVPDPDSHRGTRGRRTGAGNTRTRILDAAEELFASRGYAATPIKAVAQHAGASNVLYYFPTKQDLLDAIIRERTFAPQLRATLAAADPAHPRQTLRTIGQQFLAMLGERHNIVRIMVQSTGPEATASAHLERLIRTELQALADYLAQAVGHDQLDGPHARAIARTFMSTILAAALLIPHHGDSQEMVDHTVEVLLKGYDVPGP